MNRPITPEERAIIRWLLDHRGPTEPEVTPAPSVSELTVVAACQCGCRSVDFVPDRTGERPIRDACIRFADGVQGGVILWSAGNSLSALEFYDKDIGASRRLPAVSELQTWEQLGEASAQ
jgi:hypothetical protein